MCFFLNLFNSCATSSKNSPSKSNSLISESNTKLSTSKGSLATNNTNNTKVLNCEPHANYLSQFNTSLILHEKSVLTKIHPPALNEQLKDKLLLKSKLVLSKLEKSNSITRNRYSSLQLRREEPRSDSPYKNKVISDYCNHCGYYCCECEFVTSQEALKHNLTHFFANNKSSSSNKTLNQSQEAYQYRIVHSRPISNEISTQINNNNNNNNNLNSLNSIMNRTNNVKSQQSSSSSSLATLTNRFNESLGSISAKQAAAAADNDVDMKSPDSEPRVYQDKKNIPFDLSCEYIPY